MQREIYSNFNNPLSQSLDNVNRSPIFNKNILQSSSLNNHNGPLFLNSNNSMFAKLGTNIMGKKLNVPDFNRKKPPVRPLRLTNQENKDSYSKPDYGFNNSLKLNRSLAESKNTNLSSSFMDNLIKENSQSSNSFLHNADYESLANFNNISLDAPKNNLNLNLNNNMFNNSNTNDLDITDNVNSEFRHTYLAINNYNDLLYNFSIFDVLMGLDFVITFIIILN